MNYHIASAYRCLRAFLQQLLNKVFISALDNDLDLETIVPADQPPPPLLPATAASSRTRKHNLDWAKTIVVYCLSTVIGMALFPIQLHSNQLALTFCFLGLAILLAFACIMVSKFIQHSNSPRIIVHLFHYFGVFFGVTAFYISVTIPFPVWFKCMASLIHVASGLVVLFCQHYYK
uniref:T3.3 protein n=1 Tax=Malus x robusta TaxID=1184610 RepID=I7K8M6_9ROSA|nr:T3.3 [Malus x robusta]